MIRAIKMDATYLCAIILTLPVSTAFASSATKLGKITQHSHPMLSSIFSVANNIKIQDTKSKQRILRGRGNPSNDHLTGKLSEDQRIKNHVDILKMVTQSVPAKDKKSNHVQVVDVGKRLFPSLDQSTKISKQDTFRLHEIQTGSKRIFDSVIAVPGVDAIPGSFIEISADMMCASCRQLKNTTCIAIHCWNDQITNAVPGATLSRSPPDVRGAIPVLADNFDFRNQIDRHELQFTTGEQNTALFPGTNQGNLNMVDTNFPNQTPESMKGESTAPLWFLSDGVQIIEPLSSAPASTAPIWSMADSVNLIPQTLTDQTFATGVGGSTSANGVSTVGKEVVKQPVKEVKFIQGSSAPFVSGTAINPGSNEQPVNTLDRNTPKNINQPLDISTDILRELVRLETMSSASTQDKIPHQVNSANTPNVVKVHDLHVVGLENSNSNGANTVLLNKNPHIARAIDVFANGNTKGHDLNSNTQGDVMRGDSVSRVPQIPTASDVFPSVNSATDSTNRHMLVIKDHGTTDVVGVHIGNEPIVNDNVRLLEVPGQTVGQHTSNDFVLNPQSLTQSSSGHSHQSSNHHHSSSIVGDNLPRVPINGARQGMEKSHGNLQQMDMASQIVTTTTPIPTIDPVRHAVLQNWSKDLLQGLSV